MTSKQKIEMPAKSAPAELQDKALDSASGALPAVQKIREAAARIGSNG